MIVIRLFGSFLYVIFNTARCLVFFIMSLFAFVINLAALAGIILVVVTIKNIIDNGWSSDAGQMLMYSIMIIGGAFLYYVIMYIINPHRN